MFLRDDKEPMKQLLLYLALFCCAVGCGGIPTDHTQEEDDGTGEETETPTQGESPPVPDLDTNFSASDNELFFAYTLMEGASALLSEAFGAAEDSAAALLTLPAAASLTEPAPTGPGGGSHLKSFERTQYGTYWTRLQSAACSTTEGVVSAFFLYYNDGADENGNGLIDNTEIDVELLCAEPDSIYMSVWTDYQGEAGEEEFLKVTRKVNLRTGAISETKVGDEGSYFLTPVGSLDFTLPAFDPSAQFYKIGFTWEEAKVRFFLSDGEFEYELWEMTRAERVPQRPANIFFNLWHNSTHWDGSGDTEYPAAGASYYVDWFAYFAP